MGSAMRSTLESGEVITKYPHQLTPLSLLRRVLALGVDENDSLAQARWVRTINVVAVASLSISLFYLIFYAILDLATLWPVVVTNLFWNFGYITILRVNRAGRHRLAAWLALVVGLGNTLTPAYFLGVSSGVYLFIGLVPLVGVLVSGPTDTLMRVVVIMSGAVAFAAAPVVFADAPQVFDGTRAGRFLFVSSAFGVALFGAFFALYYRRLVDDAEKALAEANATSERLLLNILPRPVAERLKTDESAFADRIEEVTVLFADLVDSTLFAERLSADELVDLLDQVFSKFDDLTESFGLEKVATIGDAYFAVGGLHRVLVDHTGAAVELALAMREAISHIEVPGYGKAGVRIGLASGPVIAGVIGKRKFRYDLWGDTVNTASRMQTLGEPGMIHVTADVARALAGRYESVPRGEIWVKGKGMMETYFLERRVPSTSTETPEAAPVPG